jgi:holliday junction DNA helicase RuvB
VDSSVGGRFIESTLGAEDRLFEIPLRPRQLTDFVGQDGVCERLGVTIDAARQRKEPLGHCLFCGPPGLGKTTLAHIVAESMGSKIVVTSGPVLDKAADLAGILTSLGEGDLLFIDEIHRLSRTVEEYLYPAMEDFVLDLLIDSGPSARTVKVNLARFTLVGATTRVGLLSAPMRSRFGMSFRLDYYDAAPLTSIVTRSARILGVDIERPAAVEVAQRSRGTPRISNNLLRWVRDYAQVRGDGQITEQIARDALLMLSIDRLGLDEMDKKILEVIMEQHRGGPVGLNTIAVAIGEEGATIEEVYEPYLIMRGLLRRTPRGREVTPLAYHHLQGEK